MLCSLMRPSRDIPDLVGYASIKVPRDLRRGLN